MEIPLSHLGMTHHEWGQMSKVQAGLCGHPGRTQQWSRCALAHATMCGAKWLLCKMYHHWGREAPHPRETVTSHTESSAKAASGQGHSDVEIRPFLQVGFCSHQSSLICVSSKHWVPALRIFTTLSGTTWRWRAKRQKFFWEEVSRVKRETRHKGARLIQILAHRT